MFASSFRKIIIMYKIKLSHPPQNEIFMHASIKTHIYIYILVYCIYTVYPILYTYTKARLNFYLNDSYDSIFFYCSDAVKTELFQFINF